MILPLILGISGTAVTEEDKVFFSKVNPLGIVLFRKNLIDKKQSKKLCDDIRRMLGRDDAPILIDQEGGSIYRLNPPIWRVAPAPLELAKFAYSKIDNAQEKTKQLVELNAMLIAYEMKEIGINVNCAPVADLLISGAHTITSTRSFGPDPEVVTSLVNSMAVGLKAGGVQPIIKHMLGSGQGG